MSTLKSNFNFQSKTNHQKIIIYNLKLGGQTVERQVDACAVRGKDFYIIGHSILTDVTLKSFWLVENSINF